MARFYRDQMVHLFSQTERLHVFKELQWLWTFMTGQKDQATTGSSCRIVDFVVSRLDCIALFLANLRTVTSHTTSRQYTMLTSSTASLLPQCSWVFERGTKQYSIGCLQTFIADYPFDRLRSSKICLLIGKNLLFPLCCSLQNTCTWYGCTFR